MKTCIAILDNLFGHSGNTRGDRYLVVDLILDQLVLYIWFPKQTAQVLVSIEVNIGKIFLSPPKVTIPCYQDRLGALSEATSGGSSDS